MRPCMADVAIVGAGGVLGAKLVEQALARTDGSVDALTHGAVPAIPARDAGWMTWATLDLADREAVLHALHRAPPPVRINAAPMPHLAPPHPPPPHALSPHTPAP